MTEENEITTYEEAMAAWDGSGVLVREEVDGAGKPVVFVYPRLSRGVSYYNFSLRHEVCLHVFRSADTAMMWARSRGYEATRVR